MPLIFPVFKIVRISNLNCNLKSWFNLCVISHKNYEGYRYILGEALTPFVCFRSFQVTAAQRPQKRRLSKQEKEESGEKSTDITVRFLNTWLIS